MQEVLEDHFGGRLITKQNLSEWKQGGYVEWLKNEEVRERVTRLAERAGGLDDAAGKLKISDHLGSILASELADAAATLDEITDHEARWKRFREILRELARLRHEDHQSQRVQMELERQENEIQRQHDDDCELLDEKIKQRARDMLTAPMRTAAMAESFGGGKYGKKMAEMLEIINSGQSLEKMGVALAKLSDPVKPNPTRSDPVKPLLIKKRKQRTTPSAVPPSPDETDQGQSGLAQPQPVKGEIKDEGEPTESYAKNTA